MLLVMCQMKESKRNFPIAKKLCVAEFTDLIHPVDRKCPVKLSVSRQPFEWAQDWIRRTVCPTFVVPDDLWYVICVSRTEDYTCLKDHFPQAVAYRAVTDSKGCKVDMDQLDFIKSFKADLFGVAESCSGRQGKKKKNKKKKVKKKGVDLVFN
jgi:hypothetical protein